MNKTANKSFMRDENRISRFCKDLEAFCKQMNNLIGRLQESKLIVKVTDQIVKDLTIFKTDSLKKQISEEYEKEAEFISSAFAKQRFLDGVLDAYVLIDQIVGSFEKQLSDRKLSLGLSLTGSERTEFITFKDDQVSFDRDKVIEQNSIHFTGDYAQDFINRSKLLFNMLADYDREVRLLSHGAIAGISAEDSYKDGLLYVNGICKLFLDWRLLPNLDFENAEQLLSSNKQFDNKEICGNLLSES